MLQAATVIVVDTLSQAFVMCYNAIIQKKGCVNLSLAWLKPDHISRWQKDAGFS